MLYQNGVEAQRCTITVNSPCTLDGYRFHQAGFFGYGAELIVRDLSSGNAVYHEVLALERSMAAPRVTVTDAAAGVLFEGSLPQTEVVGEAVGSLLALPGRDAPFWVGLRADETAFSLTVFDPAGGAEDRAFIPLGSDATVSGLTIHFDGFARVPSLLALGVPLAVESALTEDPAGCCWPWRTPSLARR